MPRIRLAVLLLLLPMAAAASDYGSARVTEITSIYDGDTFRVNIAGWPAVVGLRVPVRVAGIDTPELRGKCQEEKIAARAARQFTVNTLLGARNIWLRNIKRGKYFRVLAVVEVDGQSLGQLLIDNGHAAPYDGGAKRGWCPMLE